MDWPVTATPAGAKIIEDKTSDVLIFVGGLGSSKSRTLVDKSIISAMEWHPHVGAVAEPTYEMCRLVLLPAYADVFEEHATPWRYNKNEHLLSFKVSENWHRIQLLSCEHPERLKGSNLPFAFADEAGVLKPDVFRHLPARVRGSKRGRGSGGNVGSGRVRQFGLFGSPEDFGDFYKWAEGERWDEDRRGKRNVVRASTLDNLFLDPSPEEYVRRRLGHLGPADLARYVDGLFVPLGMRVYPFDANVHGMATTSSPFRGRIVVGCDFNVGKMCWIVGMELGDHLHIFGEVVRRNTTTWDQVEALVTLVRDALDLWHPGGGPHTREEAASLITCFVDPSASARNTRAADSDVEQMHRAGIREVSHSHAPIPVKDRVATVSWRLRVKRITVDVDACTELTRSLQMQGYGLDGAPEKKQGEQDLSGCFAAGTLIRTTDGERPIDQIRPGEMVETSNGPRMVLAAGCTQLAARCVTATLDDGRRITCTPDHRFMTDRGFSRVDAIGYADRLVRWEQVARESPPSSSNSTAPCFAGSRERIATSTVSTPNQTRPIPFGSTGPFGSFTTGLSRMASTFITSTSIQRTTSHRISWRSHPAIMLDFMRRAASMVLTLSNTSRRFGPSPQNGIAATRAGNGTAITAGGHGSIGPFGCSNARTAASNTRRETRGIGSCSVDAIARLLHDGRPASTTSLVSASNAAPTSDAIATSRQSAAVGVAARIIAIESAPTQPVYDLTIEDTHDFFAAGVLVHNCVDALGYLVWGFPQWRASMPQGNELPQQSGY